MPTRVIPPCVPTRTPHTDADFEQDKHGLVTSILPVGWPPTEGNGTPMLGLRRSYTDGRRYARERARCAHPRGHTGASRPRSAALSHAPVSSLWVRRALLSCWLPGLSVAGEPGGHLKPDAGGGGGRLTSGRSWARGSEVTAEPGSSTRFPPLPAPPRPTASVPRAAVAPLPALPGLPSVAPGLLRLSAFPLLVYLHFCLRSSPSLSFCLQAPQRPSFPPICPISSAPARHPAPQPLGSKPRGWRKCAHVRGCGARCLAAAGSGWESACVGVRVCQGCGGGWPPAFVSQGLPGELTGLWVGGPQEAPAT